MEPDTPPSPPRLFRLAGMMLSSAEQRRADAVRDQESLRLALAEDSLDPARLPMPRLPMIPVFVGEDGRPHVLRATAGGPVAVPFDVDEPLDPAGDDLSRGGYVTLEGLTPVLGGRSPVASGVELPTGTVATAAQAVLQGDGGGTLAGLLQSAVMGQVQNLIGQGLAGLAAGGSVGAGLAGAMPFVAGGGFNPAALGASALGQIMGLASQALFSGWQVEDSSSTGEQLAHKYAQEVLGKVQGELQSHLSSALGVGSDPGSISGRIAEFFGGATSTASVPVGRLGDPDTADGVVSAGAPMVLVNGLKAARLGDAATMTKPSPDIGPIESGNPTVLISTLPATGKGHVAIGQGQGIVALIAEGSPDVFMGPNGMPLAVPTPKDAPPPPADADRGKASSSSSAGGARESAGRSKAGDALAGRTADATGPVTNASGESQTAQSPGSPQQPASNSSSQCEKPPESLEEMIGLQPEPELQCSIPPGNQPEGTPPPSGVEVCERPADLPVAKQLGIPHRWLRTPEMEAGLGPATGGVPGQGVTQYYDEVRNWPKGTTINDHAGQGDLPGSTCVEVRNIDKECVNLQLSHPDNRGLWMPPYHDCHQEVNRILSECSTLPKPPVTPPPPSFHRPGDVAPRNPRLPLGPGNMIQY